MTNMDKKQQLEERMHQEPVFSEFRSEALVLMMRIFPLAMVLTEWSRVLVR